LKFNIFLLWGKGKLFVTAGYFERAAWKWMGQGKRTGRFKYKLTDRFYFLIHEAGGIDGVVVDAHLEVEVRAGCVSGQAYGSDDLSFDNFFSRSALDFSQVAVDG
jgi:hypothetical protein